MVLRLLPLFLLTLLLGCQRKVSLNISAYDGYINHEVRTKFKEIIKEKYHLDVEIKVIPPKNNNEIGKILSEERADIIQLSQFLFKDKRLNLFEERKVLEIDINQVSNYSQVEEIIKSQSFNKYKNGVYGIPLAKYLYRLAYNSKNVQAPDSWSVLLNKKASKRYMLSNYHKESNIYLAALLTTPPKELSLTDHRTYDPSFYNIIRQLKENSFSFWEEVEPSIFDSNLDYMTLLGSSLESENSEWKFAKTKEGVIGSIDYFVLSSGLKNDKLKKKIAYEWLNFTLTKYFQVQIIANIVQDMPIISDIDPHLTTEQRTRNQVSDLKIIFPGARTKSEELWQRDIWNKL